MTLKKIILAGGILSGLFLFIYGTEKNHLAETQNQSKTVRKETHDNRHVQNQDVWPEIFLSLLEQGFDRPLHITHAGDGSGRIFVAEQKGTVRVLRDGNLLNEPFLDIESNVLSGGERGLLCIVFPPDYASKNYFYVNYTRRPDGATVISRFYLSGTDRADENSEDVLMTVDQPYANHNGGQMAFSPIDGFLYIGLGDGGSAGDPQDNAQNMNTFLGKILRIDTESGAFPYRIPDDNPFAGKPGEPEIWALGLRNPWRFSFDRETGDLYIGDVGQSLREEIDFQNASSSGGENYGWNILEGTQCYQPPSGCTPPEDYSPPAAEYSHDEGCSVTGGFVYRGERYPAMQGVYFYADYCFGTLWGLQRIDGNWEHRQLLNSAYSISSFGEDEEGSLYIADIAGGAVYEIVTDRQKGGKVRR